MLKFSMTILTIVISKLIYLIDTFLKWFGPFNFPSEGGVRKQKCQ